jgi:Kdo2-lipid IVA lauroyltransferase/acyltransferase
MASRSARARRLRYALEGACAHAFVFLIRLLPVRVASALGGWLGRTIGPHVAVSRRATANLAMVFPEKSAAERRAITRGMWNNLGRTGFEYPHLRQLWDEALFAGITEQGFGKVMTAGERGERITVAGDHIELVGLEQALMLYFEPGPHIIFSGHLGNWEILPLLGNMLKMSVDVIFRRPNNPYVDRLLIGMRGDHGGLVPKGVLGAVLSRTTLERGGLLGLLADQKHNQGVAVPFFGRPAMTAPMVAKLALQYRCPVHGAWVRRLDGLKFRVTIEPRLDIPDTGDHDADVAAILAQVNATYERWIRESPEQWMWVHRRWPKAAGG